MTYNFELDVGIIYYRKHIVALADGDHVEAYRHLLTGAEAGSPFCLEIYGLSVLDGEVPGVEPSSTAIDMIEKAIACGRPSPSYGLKLLKGEGVPQDIERGISLLIHSARTGCATASFELAAIYGRGLYGVEISSEKAFLFIAQYLPWWVRLLSFCQFGRQECVRWAIAHKENVDASMPTPDDWELQRNRQELVKTMGWR